MLKKNEKLQRRQIKEKVGNQTLVCLFFRYQNSFPYSELHARAFLLSEMIVLGAEMKIEDLLISTLDEFECPASIFWCFLRIK
jgi:hypothetical protein